MCIRRWADRSAVAAFVLLAGSFPVKFLISSELSTLMRIAGFFLLLAHSLWILCRLGKRKVQ